VKEKLMKMTIYALKIFLVAMLILLRMMLPVQGQSLVEFPEFCDDGSGFFDSSPPCERITTENSCEEPPPEELVCSEENQESPPERDEEIRNIILGGR
jgi:hypothetical protein